ncbi:hypothetical protein Bca52824_090444 [Brassica carinata]|uniref:Uncharacterized protein n=1 Tax=Brassica carinata TaxID=52824 RepID=A0A8X7TGG8_BRACI|nr:hypothetical protein Bca52824_090444 [Brassica carinata]
MVVTHEEEAAKTQLVSIKEDLVVRALDHNKKAVRTCTDSTDLSGPGDQICITRHLRSFGVGAKIGLNLTSRESLCNVWARFGSYKSGPSLVDKVLIRWHQRRIKKMPLECDWLVWSWDRLALAVKTRGATTMNLD